MQVNPDIHETRDLIASDKVVGTDVYGVGDAYVGKIERLILEKRSGRVAYAVMSFGGFLGIGHEHFPVPWEKLTYDPNLDGYRTDITQEQVDTAPRYAPDEDHDWSQQEGRRIYDYYGVKPGL